MVERVAKAFSGNRPGQYLSAALTSAVYLRAEVCTGASRGCGIREIYLENAAALSKDVGYVPVSDEVQQTNLKTLDGALSK